MKKLMIAAAMVCAAVVSQAATCGWGTGYVWGDFGGVNTYGDESSVGSYWLVALGTTDVGNYAVDTDGALVYKQDDTYQKTGVAGTAFSDAYSVSGLIQDLAQANNGDKYALIVYDSTVGAWGVSDVAVITGITDEPPVNADYMNMHNYIDAGWDDQPEMVANQALVSNVPEPTSGLLLLLGVAGLALRRRRA